MPESSNSFFGQTRGRVLDLLRQDAKTVNDLAAALDLTDNAIRAQLADLQSQDLVTTLGQKPGNRKPHVLYALTPKAHELMSRLYVPVLTTLLELLDETMPPAEVDQLIRGIGQRLARGSLAPGDGKPLKERIDDVCQVLAGLGADASVEKQGNDWLIRGKGCPLAAVVSKHPDCCKLLESLLSEALDRPVREECAKGTMPQCRFRISA
jgi:DeoR family suf operon transcriptional repressor